MLNQSSEHSHRVDLLCQCQDSGKEICVPETKDVDSWINDP